MSLGYSFHCRYGGGRVREWIPVLAERVPAPHLIGGVPKLGCGAGTERDERTMAVRGAGVSEVEVEISALPTRR